jgi:hypothetical protein
VVTRTTIARLKDELDIVEARVAERLGLAGRYFVVVVPDVLDSEAVIERFCSMQPAARDERNTVVCITSWPGTDWGNWTGPHDEAARQVGEEEIRRHPKEWKRIWAIRRLQHQFDRLRNDEGDSGYPLHQDVAGWVGSIVREFDFPEPEAMELMLAEGIRISDPGVLGSYEKAKARAA